MGQNEKLFLTPTTRDDEEDIVRMLNDPDTIVAGLNPTSIVFLTSIDDHSCIRALAHLENALIVRDAPSLALASGRVLLSFGTSVIVPPEILSRFAGVAYNIHAASPAYPGRDPHHWATYDEVTRYGATMHLMTEKVDDGPIVDVEWFDVPTGTKPSELLDLANAAAFRIIERMGPRLSRGETLPFLPGVRWSGRKRSRRDFLDMCCIDPMISPQEFVCRYRAFDGESYDNLTVTIHGQTFRIDKSST